MMSSIFCPVFADVTYAYSSVHFVLNKQALMPNGVSTDIYPNPSSEKEPR
jgi:hypothetical protein